MIGSKIDTYHIEETIGIGGTGITYKALDLDSGRHVALKMIDLASFHDAEQLKRYKEDLRILAKAKHHYIARVLRFLTLDEYFLVVTEYVQGQRLDKYIQEHWPIPLPYAAWAMEQILQALQHAHKKQVFHRNLRPGNIIIEEHGFVKLVDFGLENTFQTDQDGATRLPPGILKYMPPEQLNAETGIDYELVDIYSAGLTLYELLAGRQPFEATDGDETIRDKILSDNFQPIDEINQTLPAELAHVVMHAVEKEPYLRYQTISDMLAAFDEFRNPLLPEPVSEELSPPPDTAEMEPSSFASPRPYLIASAIILVLLSVTGLYSRFNYRGTSGSFQPSKMLADIKSEPIDTAAHLTVSAYPVDAEVRLADRVFAASSLGDVALPAGQHTVVVSREGYISQTAKIRLYQGITQNIEIMLDEVPPEPVARTEVPAPVIQNRPPAVEISRITTSGVTFTSTPPGATIWLDGQYSGTTPGTVGGLNVGKHRVVLKKERYRQYSSVLSLSEEKRMSVDVSLQPEMGQLEILARPFASIYVDGKLQKTDSAVRYSTELAAGPHLLRLEHPSLGFIEKRIEIAPGQTQRIDFDFKKRAKLKVLAFDLSDSIVYGEILIDGKPTGRYTPGELELPVGHHAVAIRRSNYLSAAQEINLESDLKLRLELQQDLNTGRQQASSFNLVENADTK